MSFESVAFPLFMPIQLPNQMPPKLKIDYLKCPNNLVKRQSDEMTFNCHIKIPKMHDKTLSKELNLVSVRLYPLNSNSINADINAIYMNEYDSKYPVGWNES